MKVLKFGGTSVKDATNISKVIEIVTHQRDKDIIMVVSALGGITNRLIEASNLAENGNEQYKSLLTEIENRHYDVVKALIHVNRQSSVIAKVKMLLNELEDVLRGILLVQEVTPRMLDMVQSFGERLSSAIIKEAFTDKGHEISYLDSRQFIKTDSNYNNAIVDFKTTNEALKDHFAQNKGLHIAPGFIASNTDGRITTLGRGGSDYTASIYAAALEADVLEIWTDVDGMMTADPRKVSKAYPVHKVSYAEAMELSHFGAKVIFPPTILPALNKRIPIRIKNTFNPESEGTLITEHIDDEQNYIRGISSIDNVCLLTVSGGGLVGVTGIASRVFGALAKAEINVIMITQGSSEHTITFAVLPGEAQQAKKAVEDEFELESRLNMIDPIKLDRDLSVVAVVGENMKNTPGISARLFDALSRNGVSVVATAQGASELNISIVIDRFHEKKALNAIHESFFLDEKKRLNLFVVGTGTIGKTLLGQILDQQEYLNEQMHIDVRLVGLANSRKMWFYEEGIPLEDWNDQLHLHGSKADIHQFIRSMKKMNLRNTVFVDNTANADVAATYQDILDASISVVTPNKIANSGKSETYNELAKTAAKRGVYYLYETNVGAGLPIISTLQDLIHSGDKILKIEAILSGTLNYIFSSFSQEKPFADTVREAKEKGFTEPDPRLDLNGMDVARKSLILGREMGMKVEPDQVSVENCLSEVTQKSGDIDEFWKLLEENENQLYADRLAQAVKEGKRLRYVATIENGDIKTEIKEIDATHPFYSIEGSDNIISFTTQRYKNNPLMVKGPGAGAEVTAAGVFADIIRILNQP